MAGKAMVTTDTTGPADKKEIGKSTGSPAAIPCGPDMETGTEMDLRIATTTATGTNMAATSAAPGVV